MRRLRAWQSACLEKFETSGRPTDFLVTATPGAGKTTFALEYARRLLSARLIDRVIVVAPTDHLRLQWAHAAAAADLTLDPTMSNSDGDVTVDFVGYVATYAQIGMRPGVHRWRCENRRTLVILDEVHHAGDGLTWGEGVREAFGPARYRLSLTGTPFRSNATERIPFVRYEPDPEIEGALQSLADFTYGYREALADKVVRPVMFAAYTGTSTWKNSAGDVIAANLSDHEQSMSQEEQAWRIALDPSGQWVRHVIAAAWERLMQVRQSMPDATALLLASNQDAARAYAQIAQEITGEAPVLILSDDPTASQKIAAFTAGSHKMAVCVRMISEGVDVPQAAVLGWLTSYRTPLFFAQAVGRVVRARAPHEVATVFLPAVRPLLALAAELETERNHVLSPPKVASDDLDALEDRLPPEPGDSTRNEALGADAEFAHILYEGRAVHGGSDLSLSADEQDFLGIPGLLSAEQTATLLKARDATMRPAPAPVAAPVLKSDEVKEIRRDINRLVSYFAMRKGIPHSQVHARLRKQVAGPPSAQATAAVLEQRRQIIREWANQP